MSHITQIEIAVTDVDALAQACSLIGVELRQQQKTFRSFGGAHTKCEMAVVDPQNAEAYELGLVRAKANGHGQEAGWKIQMDNWQGGHGMNAKVGNDAGLLLQRYGLCVARKQAMKQGMAVREERLQDGRIRLVCEPRQALAAAGGGFVGSGF